MEKSKRISEVGRRHHDQHLQLDDPTIIQKKEGSVRPSEQAYVDICVHPSDILKSDIAIGFERHIDVDQESGATVTTFYYELSYKDEICWRLKTRCTDATAYSCTTEVTDEGKLIIHTFPQTIWSKYFMPKKRTISRIFDVPGIIQASAITYHHRAVSLEIGHRSNAPRILETSLINVNVQDDGSVQVSELEAPVFARRNDPENASVDHTSSTGVAMGKKHHAATCDASNEKSSNEIRDCRIDCNEERAESTEGRLNENDCQQADTGAVRHLGSNDASLRSNGNTLRMEDASSFSSPHQRSKLVDHSSRQHFDDSAKRDLALKKKGETILVETVSSLVE